MRTMGFLGEDAPGTLRELRTAGQRTPEDMVDRYRLAGQPVRDLLVDYLRERQPALDYTSLEPSPATWSGCSGPTSNATTPASTAWTCPPRSPTRGSNGCAP